MYVAAHLMQPTRKLDRADNPNVFLFGLAPDGVYQAFPVTWKTGALLPHRFTLTQLTEQLGGLFSAALSFTSP